MIIIVIMIGINYILLTWCRSGNAEMQYGMPKQNQRKLKC